MSSSSNFNDVVDGSSASSSVDNIMNSGNSVSSLAERPPAFPASSLNPISDNQDSCSLDPASKAGMTPIPTTASPARSAATQQGEQHESQSAVRSAGGESEQETCLHVATTTWARDSHELFDYEARHVNKHSFFVNRPARAFRTALDVQLVVDGGPLPVQQADFLLSVRHNHGKLCETRRHSLGAAMSSAALPPSGRYAIGPADKNLPPSALIYPKKLWLIVKELPSGNHPLQENDVIKLGRFKLRVRQLVKAGAIQPELRLDDVDPPASIVSAEEALSMQCRICLLDGGTVEDPLVCPCQCKGSIKFVHVDCLRHWINGRLSLPEDSAQPKTSFFFKQLFCELCKTPFPSAVMLNSERVQIVKVPKIDPPFVILENIVGVSCVQSPRPEYNFLLFCYHQAANRGLHVISMGAKKELKLGRGHESDVRIADVSISRYHATIRFSEGEFILEDHQSKFGTLVSLRKVQAVEKTCALVVQIGRTVMRMSLRKAPQPFEGVVSVCDEAVPSMGGDREPSSEALALQQQQQQQGGGNVPRPPPLTPLQQQHQQHLQNQLSALQSAAAAAANELVFSPSGGGQSGGGVGGAASHLQSSELDPWIARTFLMDSEMHSPWIERGAASMGPMSAGVDATGGGQGGNPTMNARAGLGAPPMLMQVAHRSLSDYADSATSRPPHNSSAAANLMHTATGAGAFLPWISGSNGAPNQGAVSTVMTGPTNNNTGESSTAGMLSEAAAAAAARLAPLGGLRSFFLAQGGGGGGGPSSAQGGSLPDASSTGGLAAGSAVGAPVAFAGGSATGRSLPAAVVTTDNTDNSSPTETPLPSS